jgi:hypothetical protein
MSVAADILCVGEMGGIVMGDALRPSRVGGMPGESSALLGRRTHWATGQGGARKLYGVNTP